MEANDPCGSFWWPKGAPPWLLPEEIDAESALMQALADLEEDEWLDDGAMEIDSDKEFCIWTVAGLISCGIFLVGVCKSHKIIYIVLSLKSLPLIVGLNIN